MPTSRWARTREDDGLVAQTYLAKHDGEPGVFLIPILPALMVTTSQTGQRALPIRMGQTSANLEGRALNPPLYFTNASLLRASAGSCPSDAEERPDESLQTVLPALHGTRWPGALPGV